MKNLVFILNVLLTTSVSAQIDSTIGKRPIVKYFMVEPDVQIAVTCWGGEGSSLLFIPSWHATAHVFDYFAPVFTDNFKVFIMDTRGHGESSRPDHGYHIDTLTSDIKSVLDSLNIDHTVLLGLSRSASIISHFAVKYPDMVEKLIYLSGPIDRPFGRQFYSRDEVRSVNSQLNNHFDSLENICKWEIVDSNAIERPQNSFDIRPDTIGREWRNNDPSPPYQDISVPALAFWGGEIKAGEWTLNMTRDCGHEPSDYLLSLIEKVINFRKLVQDHDIELFKNEMKAGEYYILPEAGYYPFEYQAEMIENKIREFIRLN